VTSLFQQHVERWRNCRACPLCDQRGRIVLARGKVPCDVVFVGEAPGDSEDALGAPFMGPAGKLLDGIIRHALLPWAEKPRLAFTNLVACFPRESKEAGDNEPPDEAILACRSRLIEFIRIADPRLIVCVGALARDWLDPKLRRLTKYVQVHREIPQVAIKHPAAIIRMNVAMQGLEKQRAAVTITNAVEEMYAVAT